MDMRQDQWSLRQRRLQVISQVKEISAAQTQSLISIRRSANSITELTQ